MARPLGSCRRGLRREGPAAVGRLRAPAAAAAAAPGDELGPLSGARMDAERPAMGGELFGGTGDFARVRILADFFPRFWTCSKQI